ncbi:hypothetical protein D3C81_1856940 [compost metagenome]
MHRFHIARIGNLERFRHTGGDIALRIATHQADQLQEHAEAILGPGREWRLRAVAERGDAGGGVEAR